MKQCMYVNSFTAFYDNIEQSSLSGHSAKFQNEQGTGHQVKQDGRKSLNCSGSVLPFKLLGWSWSQENCYICFYDSMFQHCKNSSTVSLTHVGKVKDRNSRSCFNCVTSLLHQMYSSLVFVCGTLSAGRRVKKHVPPVLTTKLPCLSLVSLAVYSPPSWIKITLVWITVSIFFDRSIFILREGGMRRKH